MTRILFRKLRDGLKILIVCGLCPLGLSDFKTLETLSAPFSQTHLLMHTGSLHHTHFSSECNQENTVTDAFSCWQSFLVPNSMYHQRSRKCYEGKKAKQWCVTMQTRHPWERWILLQDSVVCALRVRVLDSGWKSYLKLTLLQQVCKLTSRRGWVLSKW